MGANTYIKLPANVRVRDIATVIAVAVGFSAELEGRGTYIVARAPGVKINSTISPSDYTLEFDDRHCYFHYEADDFDGRLLSPRSTAFWVAVGKRLVDFFGGTMIYNDCGDQDNNYHVPDKDRATNAPTDGMAWRDFQKRLVMVLPIHKDELTNPHAAYDSDDYEYKFDDFGFMVR